MLKITDVIIDPRTLGNKLWLVDVKPAYSYVDGHRTDTITGYRYTIALPEKGLEKLLSALMAHRKWKPLMAFRKSHSVTWSYTSIGARRISHRLVPVQQTSS